MGCRRRYHRLGAVVSETVAHWWEKIRDIVGDLWGRTTTLTLALLVAVLPILESLPYEVREMLPWWARLAIGLGGAAIALLRVIAPPPPAVVIKKDDDVTVDHVAGTVTVIKSTPIPEALGSKPAGEASTAGEVTV